MSHDNLAGLANINVELTSRCNKSCWICGRRRVDKEYPELALQYGDMAFELLEKIAAQVLPNIVIQLHNNGEALLYPRFGEAVKLFNQQITNVVTNGKLLVEKADEIIDNLDTIAISIFENDPEADAQYKIIEQFLKVKGERKPFTILRLNGEVDPAGYKKFNLPLATRILHSPMGSFNYRQQEPTVPEIGICLDFLNHLAINRQGKASICVRFDPEGRGIIGNIAEQSLVEIWNSPKRLEWQEYHKQGRRDQIPLCSYCHFWGVPTGKGYQNEHNKLQEEELFGT
ncbi:MAG: SPASM domain-containing protein [Candidatus Schekmanbacteria bacterium]|nr:SPASM domain-containing protein [Candidatus Schekmanbacteria bacterium]